MSNQLTTKQKVIFFSVIFFLSGIITLLIFIENNYRYQKIYNEKFICNAKVVDEQKDYIGGAKGQTYKYTFEYFYKGELFVKDAPHMYEFGHFKKGQNVEIILQKSNPDNFIVSESSNYWNSLWFSVFFFSLSFFSFRYRETISKNIA